MAAVRASLTAALFVKLAFEFLVLTTARSGEVRGAEWAEIDTEEHVWTVPATRTKAKREHRVPLRRRAEQILDTLQTLGNGNPLVFPSRRGKRLTDVALSGVLKDLEIRHLHADVLQHSADGLDAPLAVGNPRRRRRGGAATRRPTPQGSAKGGDEVRRQVADEPHGVGNDDLALAREPQAPRSGVEGREHLVGDVHLGARQGPQHRAPARLRMADDGQNRDRAAPPSLPPFLALRGELLHLAVRTGPGGPWVRRRSTSSFVSPGPRPPMPTASRDSETSARCASRGSRYLSCANSTCSFAVARGHMLREDVDDELRAVYARGRAHRPDREHAGKPLADTHRGRRVAVPHAGVGVRVHRQGDSVQPDQGASSLKSTSRSPKPSTTDRPICRTACRRPPVKTARNVATDILARFVRESAPTTSPPRAAAPSAAYTDVPAKRVIVDADKAFDAHGILTLAWADRGVRPRRAHLAPAHPPAITASSRRARSGRTQRPLVRAAATRIGVLGAALPGSWRSGREATPPLRVPIHHRHRRRVATCDNAPALCR